MIGMRSVLRNLQKEILPAVFFDEQSIKPSAVGTTLALCAVRYQRKISCACILKFLACHPDIFPPATAVVEVFIRRSSVVMSNSRCTELGRCILKTSLLFKTSVLGLVMFLLLAVAAKAIDDFLFGNS